MNDVLAWGTLAVAALLPIGCASSATFRPHTPQRYSAEQFHKTLSVSGASFDASASTLLTSTDDTGIFNAYAIDLETGDRTRLTGSTTDAVYALTYFPGDDRVLYTADSGGNERNHIYVRDSNGAITDLTPGDNVRASYFGFSHDGDAFYAMTNESDPRRMDLYRYDADDYARELIYSPEIGYSVASMSRDGAFLAISKVRNNADSDIFLVDLREPEAPPVHVTPHQGNVSHTPGSFTPDSSKLLYMSNEDSEWERVWAYDIATGERELYLEADWDISYVAFSHDGRRRVHAVNADAQTELFVTDTRTGRAVDLPEVDGGDITRVSFPRTGAENDRMAFFVVSSASPTNLFVHDFGTGETTRLTDTLNPAIDQSDLATASVVRYPSFDGLKIPSVLYRPVDATADNPAPGIVWVHGGPGGQSRVGYSATIQHLVNHGYAVLAVNNRGSSGYGKTFFHLDDRDHGGGDLQDCIHGRYYLESLEWIDAERIAIMGGSYGGYMVCAALAFEPDAFEVGVNIFGVTNWIRTLESIPAWWTDFREALYAEIGDPNVPEDIERMKERSPLLHAERIIKPLLVVQGANDPRVLQVESDEIVERVRANGVPVEYVVFEDEGHGFRNRDNRIEASEAYLAFFREHLPRRPQQD